MKNFAIRFKDFCKQYIAEILVLAVSTLCLIIIISVGVTKKINHEKWYDSLTAEEKLVYDMEQEQKREANISRYEVVHAAQYVRTETNQFGGVTDTDICYTFQYLQGDTLKSVDGFEHLEYGLTKVIVGDSDMYIIDRNGVDEYRYLQLTKETLKNIELKE